MNALTLYYNDPGFRGFIDQWVKDKRCPFPLADYLTDFEMIGQSACAFHCANAPDALNPNTGDQCGMFPAFDEAYNQFYWFAVNRKMREKMEFPYWCNQLEHKQIKLSIDAATIGKGIFQSESVEAAILKLLDSWVP